ncbi:MAG: N-acetyltransferase [Austwickia sp.]|jgi:uncharacterized protein|nr:N-acetyltransferase [Austwickia sp.]MBK8435885.1 N-acetyltransferase [Austwickia sp.]MBK9101571.1 N-acetyltransferase [Austwickia sp.]
MGEVSVRKNEREGRYEAYVGADLAGYSEYEVGGGYVTFPHTVTEPEHGGKGVASEVARHSLEDVRSQGLKVRPICSFYVDYLRRHPEYQDLL